MRLAVSKRLTLTSGVLCALLLATPSPSLHAQAPAGASVAREIGAKYIECSAKLGTGVQEVFTLALKESMRGKWTTLVKQRRCVVT